MKGDGFVIPPGPSLRQKMYRELLKLTREWDKLGQSDLDNEANRHLRKCIRYEMRGVAKCLAILTSPYEDIIEVSRRIEKRAIDKVKEGKS